LKTTGISSSDKRRAGLRWGWLVLPCALLTLAAAASQAGDKGLSILLKGNMTTSSQLFLNPDAADIVAQTQSLALTDFFGVGAEVKYRIPETSVAVGISADYIRARVTSSISAFPRRSIPTEDGYTVIPVEVTGYFIIPFSGEKFGVYMGGGSGMYFGYRTYRLGDTEAPVVSTKPGFGIHVLGGVSFRFWGPLEAVFEMKFRDLQFESENAFPASPVRYNGTVVNVSTKPFKSRTQTDGIVFQLALSFSL
jgi:hypothetical protein